MSAATAVAVAAGFAVTVGAGVADAASKSVTWTAGHAKFTRTISDVNPSEGDIITSKTKFERTFGGTVEYITKVKDVHPECWTLQRAYLGEIKPANELVIDLDRPDFAQVKSPGPQDWAVFPNISPKSRTFTFQYRVERDCDRNVPLMTTLNYSHTLGTSNYKDKGPAVTVKLNNSSTDLAVPSNAQVGRTVPLKVTVRSGVGRAEEGDTVEFYDGTRKIGSTRVNRVGEGVLEWTPDTAGDRSLSAKFLQTPHSNGSQSSVQAVQVSPAPDAETSTVLLGPATAPTGAEVIFGAQVSPASEGGTVQFRDGDTDLGTPVPVAEDGKASITRTFDSEGTHDITAVYSGAPGYSGSAAEVVTVTVVDAVGGPDDGDGGTGSPGNIFGS
ncbi:Ig-like domain-containing protein [Rhodococcus marinonascens]|uniref:Ig-like domain-containing protein n=1 Tax=Rhodococcus marinonascens TaxID=38311 RepID=UPI000932A1FA|nr:Ig-like domain-containing protein [Rhodococcus marinonascens]